MGSTDTILRAKWPLICTIYSRSFSKSTLVSTGTRHQQQQRRQQPSATISDGIADTDGITITNEVPTLLDFSAIFSDRVIIDIEQLYRLCGLYGVLSGESGSGMCVTSDPDAFPYWAMHTRVPAQQLPVIAHYRAYCSVLLRVNIAYTILQRVFRAMTISGHGANVSNLPPEISALLQKYDSLVASKNTYKSRQTGKRNRYYPSNAYIDTVDSGIVLYQLRAYLTAHLPLIEWFEEHEDYADNSLGDDFCGTVQSLYAADNQIYHADYPKYASLPPYVIWMPFSQLVTPVNSPLALYAALGNVQLPVISDEMRLAVLPMKTVIAKIHDWVENDLPIVGQLRTGALEWYNSTCGVAETAAGNVGSLAIAVYFIVTNLEQLYAALNRAHKQGGSAIRILPCNQCSEQLYPMVPADDDSDPVGLLLYALWLRKMQYIDVARRFIRSDSLADNIVPRSMVIANVNLCVCQHTLNVDTSPLATLDPMFASFLEKNDPNKQLIKGLPQKNIDRALDDAAKVSVLDEQASLAADGGDAMAGNNKKRASYYQWILFLLLCTLTGGYRHCATRVSFRQALAIYRYYTEMDVTSFANGLIRLRHPIRFVLREYLCHITNGAPLAIQRHGINYSAFFRSTVNICDYMRSIANDMTGPLDRLPSFISDAVVSVISSKQVAAEVKSVCGVIYRDLRRIVHPLVSYPKGNFAEFLFKSTYTLSQDVIVEYMLIHEKLEMLQTTMDKCNAIINCLKPTDYEASSTGEKLAVKPAAVKRIVDANAEFGTLPFEVLSLEQNHCVSIQFPACLMKMAEFAAERDRLLAQLKNGVVVYVLSGEEMSEILKLLFESETGQLVDTIISWLSPTAQETLVNVFRKYEFGASEKSVNRMIATNFSPKELATIFYILYCRRFLCHRVVSAPLAYDQMTDTAMSVMRLGSATTEVTDASYTVYFLPCCNRISTFATEYTSGNRDVVYNPSSALFECGAPQNHCHEIALASTPRKPHYESVLPFFGNITNQKKNNRRKYARAILHRNNKIPCDGTPAYPICLRNKRLLYSGNDGGMIVYYYCPCCARLTCESVLATRTTLTMCNICKAASLRVTKWHRCFFCRRAIVSPTKMLLVVASVDGNNSSSATSSAREHALYLPDIGTLASRVVPISVCSDCFMSHKTFTFPLSHPKALPLLVI